MNPQRSLCLGIVAVLTLNSCTSSTVDSQLQAAKQTVFPDSKAELSAFCVRAQAVVGGYHPAAVQALASCAFQDQQQSFLSHKPSIEQQTLLLSAYAPPPAQRATEYQEVWCKLKSPEAIEGKLPLARSAEPGGCDAALALAFDEAKNRVPAAAAAVAAAGYRFTFAKKNQVIGGLWAPAKVTLESRAAGEIYISSPSLETPTFFPKVGGMNYCKLVSPAAAAQLLTDLASGNRDQLPFADLNKAPLEQLAGLGYRAYDVSWNAIVGGLLPQRATLFLDQGFESRGDYLGSLIISPGGGIPAESMRGLSKAIAALGYLVFVVHYPLEFAILEPMTLRDNSAINLAQQLKQGPAARIDGLPGTAAAFLNRGPHTVMALGHSLGGALLGSAIFGEQNPFDQILLYGVTSFVKGLGNNRPAQARNVTLLIGSNDGLSLEKAENVENVQRDLGLAAQADQQGRYCSPEGNRCLEYLEGFNHFCIITDFNVGWDSLRQKDGPGPLPSQCIPAVVNHLQQRGLL